MRRIGKKLGRITAGPVSTAALAVMPKCPVCLVAMFGSIGISIPPSHFAPVLTSALLLTLPVGFLCVPVAGARRLGPVLLGLACALMIVISKLPGSSPGLLLAGTAGLLAAFAWRSYKRGARQGDCCATLTSGVPAAHGGGRAYTISVGEIGNRIPDRDQ